MATVTVNDEIGAPLERVFAMFTDLESAARHVAGIKGIEMLTPGGFRLGTRWRETREVLGRLDTADMEVTAFEKNHAYTITHYKGGARVDTVFSFAPSDHGTNVSISFGLDGLGLPTGLVAPVTWAIAGKVRDVLSHDLADLKRTLETGA